MKVKIWIIATVLLCLGGSSANAQSKENDKEFTSYDLAVFDLKGHVKRVVTKEYGVVVVHQFDEKGNLIHVSDEGADDYKISRGPEGELQLESDENVTRTSYALDNALMEQGVYRLANMWGTDGGESIDARFVYDDNGKLIKVIVTITSEDDEEGQVTENGVKVVETDSHGNWIARVVGNYESTTTRTIEYYE